MNGLNRRHPRLITFTTLFFLIEVILRSDRPIDPAGLHSAIRGLTWSRKRGYVDVVEIVWFP